MFCAISKIKIDYHTSDVIKQRLLVFYQYDVA